MALGPLLGDHLGELIRGALPPWTIPIFLFITRLGNVGVLLGVFAIDYWFGDSERGAHAISLAIGGMAFITALKSLFAAPRPPEAVNVIPISGFGFPSGHTVTATIAFGVLAFDLKMGTRRSRFAVAGLLVLLVALSRVVLGVHFVRDVVAGIVFGMLFLAGAILLTEHAPRPGFLLALGLGVAAFVVSGASRHGVSVLGASGGAALSWELLDPAPSVESRPEGIVLLAGVLPVLALAGYLSTVETVPVAVAFVLNVAIGAGLLAAPRLIE